MIVYTDGSCKNRSSGEPNPLDGVGGIGIVYFRDTSNTKKRIKKISGGSYRNTTSIRMEIQAIVTALEIIPTKYEVIDIYSDNMHCVEAMSKGYILDWYSQGLQYRKNGDLWEQFVDLYLKHNQVNLHWIKGHSGNIYNEMADRLAKEGRLKNYID